MNTALQPHLNVFTEQASLLSNAECCQSNVAAIKVPQMGSRGLPLPQMNCRVAGSDIAPVTLLTLWSMLRTGGGGLGLLGLLNDPQLLVT